MNTGALIVAGAALFFDGYETITDQRLVAIGVEGGDRPVAIRDDHGFLGNKRVLIPSLHALGRAVDRLVPAHGEASNDPAADADRIFRRLARD